ncbi:G1 family glutamic endopeptidase [Tuberibacillus calidus]|uniref:G1 family glutamic endopeptidase n=1 Tax=Tuberibacillus calidus TaxID=340097 RepID=UPI00041B2089|nr:G1 family glutamic endopeptidase [Tuberibacillus calidus]
MKKILMSLMASIVILSLPMYSSAQENSIIDHITPDQTVISVKPDLPSNFNPYTASNKELKNHHLPIKPKNKKEYKQWKHVISTIKTGKYIKPVFTEVKHKNSVSTVGSYNWSGYVTNDTYGSPDINVVSGYWQVPDVENSKINTFSSSWVGIGGINKENHLIQAGTEQQVDANGNKVFYFWWEQLPNYETKITSLSVHPGDQVFVYISYDPSDKTAWYFIENMTAGGYTNFEVDAGYSYDGSTADWIVERPTIFVNGKSSLSKLANFNYIVFWDCIATDGINGGYINDFESINRIIMVGDTDNILAVPSDLDSAAEPGTFFVAWNGYE